MTTSTFVPPQSVDEVIAQLDAIIADSIKHPSRIGYFAALYKRVTVEVKARIEAGFFEHKERMEKLDVAFATGYLLAHHQYKNGEACSASWKIAFDATNWWSPLVIQHLMVAINAHISLDLGIAASEVQPANLESLHADFNKINEVLGSLIDEVQDELAAIFWPLKPIDWILGGVDEKIAKFAMDIARDAAWKVAESYGRLTTDQERAAYIKTRDEKVARFGRKIVHPGRFIQFFVRAFRWLEYGSIRYKIRQLNR